MHFESDEDLKPVKRLKYSSLIHFRLRPRPQPYHCFKQIAVTIAQQLQKSKVITGIGIQLAQIGRVEQGLLVVQLKRNRSLLETTAVRLVKHCAEHLIDWGEISTLSSREPIREMLCGKIQCRVQGVGVVDTAELSEEEHELEHIDSDYNLLSHQQLVRLAHGFKEKVGEQQVKLDDIDAIETRTLYETYNKNDSNFNYNDSDQAQYFLRDMWEKRRGFKYPDDIADTDKVQYLIALENKRSELKLEAAGAQAVDATSLRTSLEAQEQQQQDGRSDSAGDIVELIEIAPCYFIFGGKQYEYTWGYS
jgi:hypothetical protein